MGWYYLAVAILLEVTGTVFVKMTAGFTKTWPVVLMMASYSLSAVFMTKAFHTIPLGVGYAIWSGIGTMCAAFIGVYFYNEVMSPVKIVSAVVVVLGLVGLRMG